MNILTVVETQFVARSIREHLENLEYQDYIQVLNARDAFDEINQGSFDVILLDAEWLKPGIDPCTFIKQVRGTQAGKSIPILMCATSSTTEDIKQAQEAGASGYLLKPYTEETLKEHLDRLVGSEEEAVEN